MGTYNGRSLFIFLVVMVIVGAALISWSGMLTGWAPMARATAIAVGVCVLICACFFGGLWLKLYRCHFHVASQEDKDACRWWVVGGLAAALIATSLFWVWPGNIWATRFAVFGSILAPIDLGFCMLWSWLSNRQPTVSYMQ